MSKRETEGDLQELEVCSWEEVRAVIGDERCKASVIPLIA